MISRPVYQVHQGGGNQRTREGERKILVSGLCNLFLMLIARISENSCGRQNALRCNTLNVMKLIFAR